MNLKALSIAAGAALLAATACTKPAETPAAAADNSEAAIENIMTRTSIREYQPDRTISRDTIDILLRAAMAAPTAGNMQPWGFVVVDNRADLDSLAAALPYAGMLKQASLAVVTCGNLSKTFKGVDQDFWIQDVAAATENLLLAAHALGLGAVWTGVYPTPDRTAAVKAQLALPDSIIPLAVVPVGYPVAPGEPKDKYNTENIHFTRW